ncbi:hypothetical protein BHE74_00016974 [Ensete ventricosum]|nr:hypothetical protein BHE74_00016974 [Ensete ventricosum]
MHLLDCDSLPIQFPLHPLRHWCTNSSEIVSTSESHGGDLIIQRYNRSGWRVRLLQCSHSLKGARQVRGQDRGLWIDAGVLDQGIKCTVHDTIPFLLRGVGGKDYGEDGTILEVIELSKTYSKLGDSKLG